MKLFLIINIIILTLIKIAYDHWIKSIQKSVTFNIFMLDRLKSKKYKIEMQMSYDLFTS